MPVAAGRTRGTETVSSSPEYKLTDDTRVCIVQARFEALHLGGHEVGPEHLVLGVIKGIGPALFDRLFPVRGDYLELCHALDSVGQPAPLATADVAYTADATAVIMGAVQIAGAVGADIAVTPLHLLLGVHEPSPPEGSERGRLSRMVALLDEAGLHADRLRGLLAAAG